MNIWRRVVLPAGDCARRRVASAVTLMSIHHWLPDSIDTNRLIRAWPGRHRHADGSQRRAARVAELEPGADRDGQTHAGAKVDHYRVGTAFTPHLSPPGDNEPELFDRPMLRGDGHLARAEFEVRHAAHVSLCQEAH